MALSLEIDAWDKLPTQDDYYNDLLSEILLFSGGLGSGKTHVLCRKAIQLSILNAGYPGGFLVPSYKDFRRDVKPEFESILEEDYGLVKDVHYWFNNQFNEYSFIWNKKPLYIFTSENPIAGPNLAYCLINEYSLMPFVRINEMLRRVRLKDAPFLQKCLAGTPEDVHGWLEDFIEGQEKMNLKKPDHFRIVYADTSENYHIDPNYRANLASMLDEQALKVFASGQIIRLGGDYFYYAFNQSVNVDERCQYIPNQTIYVAMDFNVGKMCTSFAHKAGREIQFFDELKLTGNSDTPQMGVAIINRYGKVDREYEDEDEWMMVPEYERKEKLEHILVTCDASGNNRKTSGVTDVMILERMGFSVRFRRSNPRLRDRQLLMNGLLSKGNIKIHPNCREIIKDFKNVQQNKKDYTKVKDKDHNLTHFSDGADYLCEFEFELDLDTRSRQIQL